MCRLRCESVQETLVYSVRYLLHHQIPAVLPTLAFSVNSLFTCFYSPKLPYWIGAVTNGHCRRSRRPQFPSISRKHCVSPWVTVYILTDCLMVNTIMAGLMLLVCHLQVCSNRHTLCLSQLSYFFSKCVSIVEFVARTSRRWWMELFCESYKHAMTVVKRVYGKVNHSLAPDLLETFSSHLYYSTLDLYLPRCSGCFKYWNVSPWSAQPTSVIKVLSCGLPLKVYEKNISVHCWMDLRVR